MTKLASLLIASLALAASATALAADGDATLLVDRGSVMTSQGGEFATAQSGQLLASGDRLMVTEGSAATVVYANDCRRQYATPGVYVIEEDCQLAAAAMRNGADGATTAGVDWPAAGMVAAGVAIGAGLLSQMDEVPGPPPPAPAPVPTPAPAPAPVSR